MRERAAASATLAATLTILAAILPACGSPSGPAGRTPSCQGPSGANRVEVVVEHGDGHLAERCVGFKGHAIAALDAMRVSRLKFASETASFGVALCSIDGEPAQYATCFPAGAPYWAMFVARQGGAWTAPSVGVQGVSLGPGDALGWRYDPQSQNPAPPPAPPAVFG
ncbi:MAG: hypothetical protein ACREPI_11495, partial [Candidatus Dormibacterales bacterium]